MCLPAARLDVDSPWKSFSKTLSAPVVNPKLGLTRLLGPATPHRTSAKPQKLISCRSCNSFPIPQD